MRVILDLLHELTNTRIFGLFHNCMWQSRYSEVNVHLFERCGRTSWLSVSLSFSKRSTNKLVFLQSHERNVYRFPEHSNGTFVLSQRVSPFYHDLD